jgi:4-hydroxybenzoate polyprenyltransferase
MDRRREPGDFSEVARLGSAAATPHSPSDVSGGGNPGTAVDSAGRAATAEGGRPRAAWRDWAQLVRLPATPTAAADILAGAVLAGAGWLPLTATLLMVLASVQLYWAGMILNDVNDLPADRRAGRPSPLVRGTIPPLLASRVGHGLLLGGVLVGLLAGGLAGSLRLVGFWPWAGVSAAVAVALAATIRLYDSPLKATALGPILMGGCRGLNLLLGVTLLGSGLWTEAGWWDRWPAVLWGAGAYAVYIAGITWAARHESREQSSGLDLVGGWLLSAVGVGGLAALPWWLGSVIPADTGLSPTFGYPLAMLLLSLPTAVRAVHACIDRRPPAVQRAVRQGLLTILFYHGLLVAQLWTPLAGLLLIALLYPARLAGRWIRMT